MIALGASQTLQGSTTTVTNTTVTVMGLLLDNNSPPGPQGYKELAQLQLGTSVGTIYGPGASNTALLASILILNTSATPQVVNLYVNGTAGSNQIASLTLPANGWAQYEDGAGWTIFGSAGIPQGIAPVGAATQAAYFSAANVLSGTALMTFVSGQINANGSTIFSGPVPWYDVKGNGCTGNGSTDDSTAFAALLATVSTAGGGIIYIGYGVNLNLASVTTFTIPGQTTIMGVTRASSIIATPTGSTSNTLFNFSATDGYFTVENIQFYSHATQVSGGCINTNGGDDIIISGCEFNSGWFNCVNISGVSIKVELEDCSFANGVNAHVLINNGAAGDTYLTRCIFDGSGSCTNNILVNATGHFSMLQCNVTNGVNGLQINPGAGQIVNDGFITHCLFDSCQTACLNLNASTSTSTIKGLHFVNAWFSGAGVVSGHTNATAVGVITQGTAGGIIDHILFDTCRMLNNGFHGVQHGFGSDFWFLGCWIAGNCNTASGATTNTADGINVANSANVGSFHIKNCRIGGSDTSDTSASNQRWGINVVGNSVTGPYQINNNDLRGNVTGPLQDLGPLTNVTTTSGFLGKSTSGNLGATTQGTLAATVAAGSAFSTTETVIVSTLIPANSVQVGTMFRITLYGTFNSTAASTATLRIRFGATTLTGTAIWNATPATTTTATGTNIPFSVEIIITVTALSASVAATRATGQIRNSGITGISTAAQPTGIDTTVATLNTTVANLLQLTGVTGATTNTLTPTNALIECVTP